MLPPRGEPFPDRANPPTAYMELSCVLNQECIQSSAWPLVLVGVQHLVIVSLVVCQLLVLAWLLYSPASPGQWPEATVEPSGTDRSLVLEGP